MSTTPTGDDMAVGLVGDIGATNARFRLVSRRHEWISDLLVLPTTQFNDGADVLRAVRAHFEIPSVAQCVLAVAGPVSGDGLSVRVVNTGLTFNQVAVQEVLGVSPVLRNDFFVQAQSVPHLKELVQIGGDKAAAGVKAILGPGSGLGMATLVPNEAGKLTVLSSEGGHGDLAPGSFLEAELWSVLAQTHQHVSWETVLSGPGIVNLYQAMSSVWGVEAAPRSAEEIVEQGLAAEPLCHQTLETFAGLLGGAAGNLALTVGARGGVYISGGIAPKLADMLPTSPLRRRFDERGDLSGYARAIPLYLVMDEHPGLLGARQTLMDL